MMNFTLYQETKKLLNENKLTALKQFGQNFLIDRDVLNKIIETGKIDPEDTILEIGPGLGTLTKELFKQAKQVISIEKDKKMIPILNKRFASFENFKLINQDILKYEIPKEKYKIIANIPYNITSPILNYFLQSKNKPKSLTLLVQKELAQKICEQKKQSILSLQVQLFAKTKLITIIPPTAFYPAPKVESAIIHIETIEKNDPKYIDIIEAQEILKIAKMAFSQKRKKLSNTIKNYIENESTKIYADKRPQHLAISDWQNIVLTAKKL